MKLIRLSILIRNRQLVTDSTYPVGVLVHGAGVLVTAVIAVRDLVAELDLVDALALNLRCTE